MVDFGDFVTSGFCESPYSALAYGDAAIYQPKERPVT